MWHCCSVSKVTICPRRTATISVPFPPFLQKLNISRKILLYQWATSLTSFLSSTLHWNLAPSFTVCMADTARCTLYCQESRIKNEKSDGWVWKANYGGHGTTHLLSVLLHHIADDSSLFLLTGIASRVPCHLCLHTSLIHASRALNCC